MLTYLIESGEEVLRFPERAADLLINEILRSVEEPFILVLDDYHHIGRDTAVHKIVDRVVQYSSDLVHLIITTRDLPPLAMMRRRSQSAALVITRDDLLFTDDEVKEPISPNAQRRSKGRRDRRLSGRERMAGSPRLQLVRQRPSNSCIPAHRRKTLDLTEILKQSERDISDYFAEEVFSRESDEIRELLMRSSLLESLDQDACRALFPDIRCSALLPEIAQKNVFLTVAGDSDVRRVSTASALSRFFAKAASAPRSAAQAVAAERVRIAEYFLGIKKWETALPYLLDAENFSRAAEIVAETGTEWIAAGAFTSLRLVTERIPGRQFGEYPRSLSIPGGSRCGLTGDIQDATGMLRPAVELLDKNGDRDGEAEASTRSPASPGAAGILSRLTICLTGR